MCFSFLKAPLRRLIFLFLLSCCCHLYGLAQEKLTVTGKITEKRTNNPIANATITVKASAQAGALSDTGGNFTMTVLKGAMLVISHVNYSKHEVKVTGDVLSVQLADLDNDMSEVVVIGYSRQKKVNLTGAVSTVSTQYIKDRPLTDATQALSGAVPGVFVNQNSGLAGQDGATIRIRGIGTLNNTNPLILIDGVEGSLNQIDPNDIASISVLKDAASASIYGSRGANGVVLVTTKKGSYNKKPSLSYNGLYGITEATRLPAMVTDGVQYMQLFNEAQRNSGAAPKFSQADIDRYKTISPNTDWFKTIFRSAPMHQHNLTLSGGGENINYLLSAGYLQQEAITPGTETKKYSIRLNVEGKVNARLSMGTNLFFVRRDLQSPSWDIVGSGGDGGVVSLILKSSPLYPAYDNQGRIAGPDPALKLTDNPNPAALLTYNTYNNRLNQFMGNGFMEYEIINGLKVKGTLALNHIDNKNENFAAQGDRYDWISGTKLVPYNLTRSRNLFSGASDYLTSWLQASYDKEIGSHRFSVLVGASQEYYKYASMQAGRSGFSSNIVRTFPAAPSSTATNEEDITDWVLRSVFGRLNYNFDERYLFEFNIRRDGSSRFGADNRYGIFPSFSAGWILSRESFFHLKDVNLLKIRGSWGQLGNQYAGANGTNNYPYSSQVDLGRSYNFNGVLVPGAAQKTYYSPNIKWETSTTTNIGLDIGLFNKLDITAEYFIRTTKDILNGVPVPATAGGFDEPPFVNIGKVRNQGWELSATWNENIGKFRFSISGNVTHVTSKLLYIDPSKEADKDLVIAGAKVLKRGEALNSLYGYQVTGVFQNAEELAKAPQQYNNPGVGDLRFADINGDNIVNNKDRTIIGREDPSWLYGANITAGYKGFDFSVILQGMGNFKSYAGMEFYAPFYNDAGLGAQWLDRWTPENPTNKMPKLFYQTGANYSDHEYNSFWVLNRAYLRLKNIQLGYTLPEKVTGRFGMQRVRIYVNGQNLATATHFLGTDPERPEGAARGGSAYPLLKVYSAGINVNF